MNKFILLLVILLQLSGCGPSQEKFDQVSKHAVQLEAEVKALKAELSDIKFGANRLLTQARSAVESKDDTQAKKLLTDLLKRHSSSPESEEAKVILSEIDSRIAATELQLKLEKERKAKEEKIAFERVIGNMKKDTDEIKGITWISHRNTPILANYVSLYFGTKNNSAGNYPLRMKLHYYDDDWLFIRSVTVKADDKVYELGRLDFERDHGSGSVWEWIDMPVRDHSMLKEWMNAKRVVVRFEGDQYYKDFTLPQKQQVHLRDVYKAWETIGGKS